MNKRHEEKLIQLAYGELAEADELALRREISDAELEAFVADYQVIRESLPLLNVPEHQLSTERLRDAILNQGLEPRGSTWNWMKALWAPAAMVAAAFAIVNVWKSSPTAGDPVVMDSASSMDVRSTLDPSALDFQPSTPNLGTTNRSQPVTPSITKTSPSVIQGGQEARNLVRRKLVRVANQVGRSNSPVVPLSEAKENLSMLAVSAISRGSSTEGTENIPAPAVAESQPTPAIIIIEKAPDAMTGANRAIEVDSSSNVVIGG